MLNKISEWFKVDEHGHGGLADWDISRDAPYFGIEIPDAPGKYFYVWLDAPVGYLASLKNYFDKGGAKANGEPRSFDEFMADPAVEQIHFIGKDIIYFHTLFWPAMLKFSGRKVPDHVYVHGFITVSGEKMSKSRGTGISPLRYLEIGMNAEWLRYYIAAKLNAHVEDIDFNPDDFVARVNTDLVGKYVNIASRAANFINKRFAGELRVAGDAGDGIAARRRARRRRRTVADCYEAREYGKALREIMAIADRINAEFDAAQPWLLAKDEARGAELQDVCSRALHGFQLLSVLLAPVLPALARRVARELFGLERDFVWSDAEAVPTRIAPYRHLMQRVDPKQLDALFEAPAEAAPRRGDADRPAAARRRGDRRDDHDRRLRQARPAHRPHRRLREGRGLDQAAEADARCRRGANAHRLQRHPVGLRARAAGRQAHRDGRQPGAAQDEVRRQRRHGAGRLARRRQGAPRACSSSSRTPARCPACAFAEATTPMSNDAAATVDIVRRYDDRSWGDDGPTRGVEDVVEAGQVLAFPRLAFALDDAERRFLDPRWADVKAKNVSVRWPSGELRGAVGDAADLAALRAMIVRFAEQSEAFALRLFPHYRGHLRRGNTSFRPTDVAGRVRSWRQDDTRLHVDAFPSNPMQGTRLLRVFSNVNPNGEPRRWRVGEPFEAHAQALPRRDPPAAGRERLADAQGRHHEAAPHRVRPRHAPAPRPRQGRPRLPARRPAGAGRLRAGNDLGRLQRPGPARGDGRAAHAGADLPSRRREPAPAGDVAAANARAAAAPVAALAARAGPLSWRNERAAGAGTSHAREICSERTSH